MTAPARPKVYELRLHPGFKQDIQRLNEDAQGDRFSREYVLLSRALDMVKTLETGAHPTKPLEFLQSYGDLSDCNTNYIGSAGLDEKPSHRLISRELPPLRRGGLPVLEIIALGERRNGAAYDIAAIRLGRPVGIPLHELAARPEPIAAPEREAAIWAERDRLRHDNVDRTARMHERFPELRRNLAEAKPLDLEPSQGGPDLGLD